MIKIINLKNFVNEILDIEKERVDGSGIKVNIDNDLAKDKGLGLHINYKIVNELLNGEISAQNTLNGAKFTIKLPLIK